MTNTTQRTNREALDALRTHDDLCPWDGGHAEGCPWYTAPCLKCQQGIAHTVHRPRKDPA